VLVLIVIAAAVVVVAAVIFLATGRGGGMSAERNDYFPIDLGPVSATDVALLRPPTGLWGYNMQATDEAMELIAEAIRERDVRIVALEQLVTDLSRDHAPMPLLASPYAGARHRRPHVDTADTETVEAANDAPVVPASPVLPESSVVPTMPVLSASPVPPGSPVPPASSATPATGSVRFPFEPPRPSGEMSGPPPERSHD
jgi:hypothetical protein